MSALEEWKADQTFDLKTSGKLIIAQIQKSGTSIDECTSAMLIGAVQGMSVKILSTYIWGCGTVQLLQCSLTSCSIKEVLGSPNPGSTVTNSENADKNAFHSTY